ncbi:MAG: hypothetical protein RLZZ39_681 [Actinomycetota bacterium]
MSTRDEHTDELPEDLVPDLAVRAEGFPDNSRRRVPGLIYLVVGVAAAIVSASTSETSILSNAGLTLGGVVLALVGLYSLSSGWRMKLDEHDALGRAGTAVGFTIGHASAQQVWRGVRSRPTWRVLCYSDEDPPRQRGLVLVDAIDGQVVQVLVQPCDEDWSTVTA